MAGQAEHHQTYNLGELGQSDGEVTSRHQQCTVQLRGGIPSTDALFENN